MEGLHAVHDKGAEEQMKPQRSSIELYRMGTLLFASAAFISFIVLFLFILVHDPAYVLPEAMDLVLATVLMLFSLLFGIALALAERRVRLNAKAGAKKPA